ILIISFQRISYYTAESTKKSFKDAYDEHRKLLEGSGNRLLEEYKSGPKEDKNSAKLLKNIGTEIEVLARKEEYTEINRILSFGYLIKAKAVVQTERELIREKFNENAIKIWDDVSNGIKYEDVVFKFGDKLPSAKGYIYFQMLSRYHQLL